MDELNGKTSNGIKKRMTENDFTFQNYKDCLFTEEEITKRMNLLRSYHGC